MDKRGTYFSEYLIFCIFRVRNAKRQIKHGISFVAKLLSSKPFGSFKKIPWTFVRGIFCCTQEAEFCALATPGFLSPTTGEQLVFRLPLPEADEGRLKRGSGRKRVAPKGATIFFGHRNSKGRRFKSYPCTQQCEPKKISVRKNQKPQWFLVFLCQFSRCNSKDIISPKRLSGRIWTKYLGF